VYQDADLDTARREVAVESIEVDGDSILVNVGFTFLDQHFTRPTIRISAQGIAELRDGQREPVWLLRGPFRIGTKWEGTESYKPYPLKRNAYELTVTRTISAIEWVDVPAGRFWAVRVNSVLIFDSKPVRVSRWYAPDVGLIKEDDGRNETVLRSFVPGER
jgi:hypothetical protein